MENTRSSLTYKSDDLILFFQPTKLIQMAKARKSNTRSSSTISTNFDAPNDILKPKEEAETKRIYQSYLQELKKITLTPKQQELFKMLNDSRNKIITITGPAGTAKTFTTCYFAINTLASGVHDKIIFSKPLEEAGEKMGYLPGDIADKINPFFASYKQNMSQMLKESQVTRMYEKKMFEYTPIAFIRGNTYNKKLLVLDECQNADLRQIILFTTRMGKESKVILLGDTSQTDIKRNVSGLSKFADLTKGMDGVKNFEFTKEDIQRDPILIELIERYEKYKDSPEFKNKGGI